MSFGGGGHNAGPTAQQQALQAEQATTNATLNLEENEQRKTILNALQGTRVFRGSALSRQIAKDSAATAVPSAPSSTQTAPLKTAAAGTSLLDATGQTIAAAGATTALSSGSRASSSGRTPNPSGR